MTSDSPVSSRSDGTSNFSCHMLDDTNSNDVYGIGGAMLPIFLNDLHRNNDQDLVEVTLELEDDSIILCSVTPTGNTSNHHNIFPSQSPRAEGATSRLRRKFSWLTSSSSRASSSDASVDRVDRVIASRDARKMKAKLMRNKSSAQRALGGLRFISKSTNASDVNELWKNVEARFGCLAKDDGLLAREDFAECIGMADSKEFALGVFDALARRRQQKLGKITKAELYDFWLQISDQSFDARLQIFFDMADSNEDGRITRDEIQELLVLSAAANRLSKLKEQAEEYASLIMEELDPENLGYIELWQLETLLLQREAYMNYSRPLSIASGGWSQNLNSLKPKSIIHRLAHFVSWALIENWQRTWILLLWVLTMACLFTWKFKQYRDKAAFHVMGYCLTTAKGAAETLKLNMALILLPVCRNMLTFLRSTRARFFIPFDDNINFHKIIAVAIATGIALHAGNHMICDFPRLVNSSEEKFALIASDFHNKKPTYKELITGVEGVTGISMLILMAFAFTLASRYFRKNLVKLPSPFNRLTGFNAFWFSHHLFGLVYILLLIHGSFLFLVHNWGQKTTWMYISVPLLIYGAERSLRTGRSEHYSPKIIKVSNLPGDVFSIIMTKPNGFKYRSGQYYNDLYIFDLDTFKWQEIKPTPGCLWPSARSGFQLFVHQDDIYLYGGYSKVVSSDPKNSSEKGIVHSDMWLLDPKTWVWNKVKKGGMPPGPRAGFSMCVHKKRAVLFGGVVDMEAEGDVLMSLFLNELYGFQLDINRWYPLELRKEKSTKAKNKKIINEEAIDQMEVVTNDEDDNMDCDIDEISSNMERNIRVNGSEVAGKSSTKTHESTLEEVVKPCGRINASMVVGRDTLYIYGGMMEIRDQEITLDDLYALNLSKLDEWKCLLPASESEWVEVSEDDEDDEDDDDDDEDSEDENENGDSSETDEDEEDDDVEAPNDGVLGDAVAIIKGHKKLRRKEKRARIEQIRASLGLSDSQRTPVPGEALKDFYKRTNSYWQMAAYEHTAHTGKELRKDGFDLAETRYKELKPILDELAILEAEQKAEEAEGPETSGSRKKGTKKNKHIGSK